MILLNKLREMKEREIKNRIIKKNKENNKWSIMRKIQNALIVKEKFDAIPYILNFGIYACCDLKKISHLY